MADKIQTPSIGRMVHFIYGGKHVPAIITDPEVFVPPTLDSGGYIEQALTVLPVGEPPFTTQASYDTQNRPATWHFPEYVPIGKETS